MSDERIWSEIRINHFDEDGRFFTVDAWETTDDNEEGKVIAKIYASNGYVEYLDPRAEGNKYVQEEIENAWEMVHSMPIVLSKQSTEYVRKIIEMNKQIKQMAHAINQELAKYDYATAYAYADDDFPIQELTEQNLIENPEFKKNADGKDVLVHNGCNAVSNNDGVFVHQVAGYCEDDWTGTTYVKMHDGAYVAIEFAM